MDDEKYYETVARELRENRINDALWTKAIAKSGGAEDKTKATYIQLRVDQLIKEEQQQALSETAVAEDSGWDDGEESEDVFMDDSVKRAIFMVAKYAFFIVAIWAIWTFLFPWVRSLKADYFN